MQYDYRDLNKSLFKLEYPEDLSKEKIEVLDYFTIGLDVSGSYATILLSKQVNENVDMFVPENKKGFFSLENRKHIKLSDFKESFFKKHYKSCFLLEFDKCGNIIRETEFKEPCFSKLTEDESVIYIRMEYV